MTDLEQEILEIINTTIKGFYIKKLKVLIEDGWYYLALEMNQDMSPLVMGWEGDNDEGFKDFIEKEIRARGMQRVSYWTGVMTYDENFNYS